MKILNGGQNANNFKYFLKKGKTIFILKTRQKTRASNVVTNLRSGP